MVNLVREKYGKATTKWIIRFFTSPYKVKTQGILAKISRNTCVKTGIFKFQVYSLQM